MKATECTGCGACSLSCPTNAISMREDIEGFYYPSVDNTKCIDCGLCEKVCHLNKKQMTPESQKAYAVVNKNMDVVRSSSSGGVFTALAEYIIRQDGICFGVCQDANDIYFSFATDSVGVKKMRGSKYVYAEMNDIYKRVDEACKSGRYVLFTGTPCQVAGVKAYLRKEYPNLFTVDIVCHGAPSHVFYEHYLRFLEDRFGSKVSDFRFRDKSGYGVSCISSCSIVKKRKRVKKILTNQLENYYYYYMFADSYRESCYNCHYNNLNRPSDITIGDFWGIEKLGSKLETNSGCSSVIINSKKGLNLISDIQFREMCSLEEHPVNAILQRNTALKCKTERPERRNTVYQDMIEHGFDYLVSTRYKLTIKKYFVGMVKGVLPPAIQKMVHKYL